MTAVSPWSAMVDGLTELCGLRLGMGKSSRKAGKGENEEAAMQLAS